VSAFEQARGRPCTDPEIEVVLAALEYNELPPAGTAGPFSPDGRTLPWSSVRNDLGAGADRVVPVLLLVYFQASVRRPE
jgi:hypothetical protein